MSAIDRVKNTILNQQYGKGLKARLFKDLNELNAKELIEVGCAAANTALLSNNCTRCSRSVAEYLLRWVNYSDEKILKYFPSKIAYLVNSTSFVGAVRGGHKKWLPITTNKQKVGV